MYAIVKLFKWVAYSGEPNNVDLINSSSLIADLSQVWPEANQHFSKEIDDEANSYFQRIYNHPPHPTMSVDEVYCSFH